MTRFGVTRGKTNPSSARGVPAQGIFLDALRRHPELLERKNPALTLTSDPTQPLYGASQAARTLARARDGVGLGPVVAKYNTDEKAVSRIAGRHGISVADARQLLEQAKTERKMRSNPSQTEVNSLKILRDMGLLEPGERGLLAKYEAVDAELDGVVPGVEQRLGRPLRVAGRQLRREAAEAALLKHIDQLQGDLRMVAAPGSRKAIERTLASKKRQLAKLRSRPKPGTKRSQKQEEAEDEVVGQILLEYNPDPEPKRGNPGKPPLRRTKREALSGLSDEEILELREILARSETQQVIDGMLADLAKVSPETQQAIQAAIRRRAGGATVAEAKAGKVRRRKKKRENPGVSALALALPNPAGPGAVPPDFDEMEDHMARPNPRGTPAQRKAWSRRMQAAKAAKRNNPYTMTQLYGEKRDPQNPQPGSLVDLELAVQHLPELGLGMKPQGLANLATRTEQARSAYMKSVKARLRRERNKDNPDPARIEQLEAAEARGGAAYDTGRGWRWPLPSAFEGVAFGGPADSNRPSTSDWALVARPYAVGALSRAIAEPPLAWTPELNRRAEEALRALEQAARSAQYMANIQGTRVGADIDSLFADLDKVGPEGRKALERAIRQKAGYATVAEAKAGKARRRKGGTRKGSDRDQKIKELQKELKAFIKEQGSIRRSVFDRAEKEATNNAKAKAMWAIRAARGTTPPSKIKAVADAQAALRAQLQSGQDERELVMEHLMNKGFTQEQAGAAYRKGIAAINKKSRGNPLFGPGSAFHVPRNNPAPLNIKSALVMQPKPIAITAGAFLGGFWAVSAIGSMADKHLPEGFRGKGGMIVGLGIAAGAYSGVSYFGRLSPQVRLGLTVAGISGAFLEGKVRGWLKDLPLVGKFFDPGESGTGDLYDDAFNGTGAYVMDDGMGAYVMDDGMGAYVMDDGMGAYVEEPAGVGEFYEAPAGVGEAGTEVVAQVPAQIPVPAAQPRGLPAKFTGGGVFSESVFGPAALPGTVSRSHFGGGQYAGAHAVVSP